MSLDTFTLEEEMVAAEEQLAAMTLEEKASLLTGDTAWTTATLERIGLQPLRMADGPHGVRRTHASGSMALEAHAATCFPTASCTSATWDPELIEEMGRAIAREAIALEVDVVLGPGANIKRSPLCGRNFEYFSEDPYLSGEMAAAWIDGVQALGVGASLKHFAVNNQETRRMSVSAEVDERTMRELYLPAFERAVTESQPWTVMCAYNRVNGTYASAHRELLTEILRDEWGFDGFVVSDWGAVHDRPTAVAAGLDLEMPGPRPRRVQAVIDAVETGALDEEVVDRSALRILRIVERAARTPKGGEFDAEAHHGLARRIAVEGMVLLKNDGLLPLADGGRIAIIGRAAQAPQIQGRGSSQITPTRVDSPLEELTRLLAGAQLTHADGYDAEQSDRPQLIAEAVEHATAADVAVVFATLPDSKETEGRDRADIELGDQQVALIEAVATVQPRTAVVLFNGSAVSVAPWVDRVAAVVEAWYAGQAVGGAIADVLTGAVDPGGRLAETFPLRLEDTPAFLSFPGDGDTVRYAEGTYVGYRWYDARRMPVRYPFGHGLSYTTFEYSEVRAAQTLVEAGQGPTIEVTVTNTGERAGSDVVQVYARDRSLPDGHSPKRLCGFSKVRLGPGESRAVTIETDGRALATWDPLAHRWDHAVGPFELQVGRSASEVVASVEVEVVPLAAQPSRLSDMSPLRDWLMDERGGDAARQTLLEIAPILGQTFGEWPEDDVSPVDHFDDYFGTMPLRSVLEFAAAAGGPEPEAKLAELLGGLVEYAEGPTTSETDASAAGPARPRHPASISGE